MLLNAYFLAKFRFDTAENEPAKKLQKCCKICAAGGRGADDAEAAAVLRVPRGPRPRRHKSTRAVPRGARFSPACAQKAPGIATGHHL